MLKGSACIIWPISVRRHLLRKLFVCPSLCCFGAANFLKEGEQILNGEQWFQWLHNCPITSLYKTNFHRWTGPWNGKIIIQIYVGIRFWMKKTPLKYINCVCVCINFYFLIPNIIQESSLYSQAPIAKFHKRKRLHNFKKIVISNWSLCENKTNCPCEGFCSRCTGQFCPYNFHLFQCRIQDCISLNGFCKDLV